MRRSLGEWLWASRYGPSPTGSGGPALRCHAKWRLTGAASTIGLMRRTAASRIRARRPKPAKLACNRQLREAVEEKLEAWWSPVQISGWLIDTYPDDGEMRVSHETIYQSLFIQGKGALAS